MALFSHRKGARSLGHSFCTLSGHSVIQSLLGGRTPLGSSISLEMGYIAQRKLITTPKYPKMGCSNWDFNILQGFFLRIEDVIMIQDV